MQVTGGSFRISILKVGYAQALVYAELCNLDFLRFLTNQKYISVEPVLTAAIEVHEQSVPQLIT